MPDGQSGDQIERAAIDYERDGAAVLRGVVSRDWIARLSDATDRYMASGFGSDISAPEEGRFFNGFFCWRQLPEYEAFIRGSGLGAIAGRIMGAHEVRFFYDQLLVKEPGSVKPTPWHQDLPYWPVKGQQIISVWVPMDPATPENGVVTYVKGSHKWNAFFPEVGWSRHRKATDQPDPNASVYRNGPDGLTLRDVAEHPERFEFLTWDMEPGDVLVHHPLTVHGAKGNLSSANRRRALATRWLGDDVRWDDTRNNFIRRHAATNPSFPALDLKIGSPLVAPLFPLVWCA